MKHFKTISEFSKYAKTPAPEHPMFYVFAIRENGIKSCMLENTPPITTDFYSISFKKVISGEMKYGRTKYDFSNGAMVFTAPDQIIQWSGIKILNKSFGISFHKDFIKNHELGRKIKKYGFFSYSANEALHLSPKEENIIESIFNNIETEYHNNQDEFSKEIILSHLETLLKYSDRFYKRQFINRKDLIGDISSKFKMILIDYFESGKFEENGIPTIDFVAKELSISTRYLTDALKAETGKTAIEHIHLHLIDEAKNILLQPNLSISEVAYKLGFEYPQYFSRLFKKKVGLSPTKFREEYSNN